MSIHIAPPSLQLLLFVDRRPGTHDRIGQIQDLLTHLQQDLPFDLKVIDVIEHPNLAERYRIVTTPTLVKIETLARDSRTHRSIDCPPV
jgi:two-component system clock-associated histidine kinase SasA